MGEEVAYQMIVCLSTELGIKLELLAAGMRDRASINSVTTHTLSIVYLNVLDVGRFSHTVDHVRQFQDTHHRQIHQSMDQHVL